jgi:peptidoglycan/xylan/chitin deacetylase (PgdA/CDA1 family)/predicted ATP-grasp superfamily ATP-dependent carboligase
MTGSSRPRVLVTEATERGPLAACRSLKDAGYTVTAVSETRLAAGLWSRSCHERLLLPDAKAEPEAFVAALEELLGRREYDVLVPGAEASLLAISENGQGLEKLVRLGLPAHEIVVRSLDKVLLLSEAAAAGMAPPPSVVCATPDEASQAADELGYPAVLKPRRSILRERGGTHQQGVVLATTPHEVKAAVAMLSLPLIVQRFESGVERLSCAGVLIGGELLGLAVARFERTWPPNAGAASFAETVRPREDLVTATVDLLQALGWEGVFELEALAYPDGRLAAMDLNPRLFGWLALAVRAGADLPAIWCDVLLERKRAPVVARPGVPYRWEDAEVFNLLRLVRAGRLAPALRLMLPRRRVVHAHFQWRDPVPLFARSAEVLVRRARGRRQAAAVASSRHRSRVVRPVKGVLVRSRSTRWSRHHNGDSTRLPGLRILFYHRVSDERDDDAVPPLRFREQMDCLHEEGYSALDIAETYRLLKAGELPPRTIALSFDDGYQDVADVALPVLSEHGFRATVFIVPGAIDGTASFRWYRRQPPLLGWDEIVRLDREGRLRFEAHSVTHANLTILSAEAAGSEIRGSKVALERRLARPVDVFSYPGGDFTAREERLVAEAGYRLAVSCEPGINLVGSNPFALFRQAVEPRDSMLDFRAKLAGAHDSPLPLQHLYHHLRNPRRPHVPVSGLRTGSRTRLPQ